MNKILVLLLAFSGFSANAQECNSNSKKVVVMLTMHGTIMEVKAAREAACARGERLVLLPEMTDVQRTKIENLTQKLISTSSQMYKYASTDPKRYEKMYAEAIRLNSALNEENEKVKKQNKNGAETNELLTDLLSKFDKNGTKVQGVIVSGHNGGSGFYGDLGRVEADDIAMQAVMHPSMKDLKSIYLLGCNSAGPDRVMAWSSMVPSLEWVIGYSDSAPHTYVPKGAQYLKDMMLAEAQATKTKDQKQLKGILSKYESFHSNYVGGGSCAGNKVNYFYTEDRARHVFVSENKEQGNGAICNGSVIYSVASSLNSYSQGWSDFPKDNPASGDLRSKYTLVRQFESCFTQNSSWTGDRAGLLLFYEGVKKNFTQSFKEAITKGAEAYKSLKDGGIDRIQKQMVQKSLELENMRVSQEKDVELAREKVKL